MSTTFLLGLLAIPAVALALRLTTELPSRRAHTMPGLDLALLVLGAVGLVFHCTAMFFPAQTALVPGTGPAAAAVNDFGTASMLLFVAPSVLVLVALRRVWLPALVVLAGTLAAVGITMYVGSPLDLHLSTIAAAVLVLSSVAAGLLRLRPRAVPSPAG
ncbi:hypothetical protein [Lapillicoccus sp.]|uniref:hypothetical protein n=1 Tax=Lapillicoccus sp. TaxID=1909287 RepID=UPI0039833977